MKTATHRIPGLVLTDHVFTVPVDHDDAGGATLEVFAREVAAPGAPDDRPWLVFLQGGPGFSAPRPSDAGGWIGRAIEEYRVLLLDQRGTGRSTPVLAQTLAHLTPAEQAGYLRHFRADAIVRDAELIRRELCDEPWSVLGQSFGGFCATRYLSAAPEGLAAAWITGGLPPIGVHPDDFYRATFRRTLRRNHLYAARYPGDAATLQRVVRRLEEVETRLPDGAPFSPRRLQQLGWAFGASDGFEQVHYLLEQAFVAGPSGDELSQAFLRGVWTSQQFETNPIYAVLHEACLCDGSASRWSAQRVRDEFPELAPDPDRPLLLTGETIFPWMLDEYPGLAALRDATHLLAEREWPPLYDRAALAANEVPCAAAVYYDDMYVERAFSEDTAEAIRGLRVWVTNEYEHNGLRADGARILDRLIAMTRGEA